MQHEETIKQFIIDEFLPDVATAELDPEADLLADGVIDSLGLLKVIAWLEDRFEISPEEIEISPDDFRSVAAIGAFIELAAREDSGAR